MLGPFSRTGRRWPWNRSNVSIAGTFLIRAPDIKISLLVRKHNVRERKKLHGKDIRCALILSVYAASQKISQRQWAKAHPGYWKEYRKNNPQKAQRNRVLQTIRNRKARSSPSDAKMDASLIAKMDSSNSDNFEVLGQFWLIPVIAKMDSFGDPLKV